MRSKRVLILHNQPVLSASHPDADSEEEIVGTAHAVAKILARSNFEISRLALGRNWELLSRELECQQPDVVFNLFEGLADRPSTEADVAAILENSSIPFTGCGSQTLRLALNKPTTKQMLLDAGLPTPRYVVAKQDVVDVSSLEWPLVVKPAFNDASVGIDQASVVTNRRELRDRVSYLFERFGPPMLIEEFIAGREFTVAIVDSPQSIVLPPLEILFLTSGTKLWPIVTYDAKWKPGSADYEATPPDYRPVLEPNLAQQLHELSLSAYHVLRCRDFARIDFRVDSGGDPYVLEVNPNPDLSPIACLAGSLAVADRSYDLFVIELVRNALARRIVDRSNIGRQYSAEQPLAATNSAPPVLVPVETGLATTNRQNITGSPSGLAPVEAGLVTKDLQVPQ